MRLPLWPALAVLALAACDSGSEANAPSPDASEGDTAATSPDIASPDAAADTTDATATKDSEVSDAPPSTDGTTDADSGVTPLHLGCDGATLLPLPVDYAAAGPWPVGARTIEVAGLTTEVWYPATPGSEAGLEPAVYDIRLHLPEEDQGKIPDDQNPWQPCDCVRDLPLDEAHGPYPTILFIHGTGGFRTQSLTQMTHWASRGFVVVAADHPGLTLADALHLTIGGDFADQATQLLGAIDAPSGGLAFLAGHIDPTRKGVSGHSAGGGVVSALGALPGVRVIIPMAAGGAEAGASLESTLVLGGLEDGIVPFTEQQKGYAATPPRKRLVGLGAAGHLAFSDICLLGKDQGGLLQIAEDNGVAVSPIIAGLAKDGCLPGQLAPEAGFGIIDDATSAAFEETLHCDPEAAAALASLKSRHSDVSVYEEALE